MLILCPKNEEKKAVLGIRRTQIKNLHKILFSTPKYLNKKDAQKRCPFYVRKENHHDIFQVLRKESKWMAEAGWPLAGKLRRSFRSRMPPPPPVELGFVLTGAGGKHTISHNWGGGGFALSFFLKQMFSRTRFSNI